MSQKNQEIESTGVMTLLIQVLLLGSVATWLCKPIFDAEFFGHLTIGRWIQAHGSAPEANIWTALGAGADWHSTNWLFQYLLADIDSWFGEVGWVMFKAVCFLIFTALLSFLYYRRSREFFFSTLIALGVSCGTLTAGALNSYFLAALVFVALLTRLEYQRESTGLVSTVNTVLLTVLLANCSLAFFAALGFCAVQSLGHEGGKERVKTLCFLLLLAVVGAVVSPYFGLHVLGGVVAWYQQLQLELLFQLHAATVFHYGFSFLLLLWMLFVLFWQKSSSVVPQAEAILAGLLAVLALGSMNYLPFALVSLGLVLTTVWGKVGGESIGPLGEGLLKLRQKLCAIPRVGLVWLLVCVVIVNVVRLKRDPVLTGFLPETAIDYLEKEELSFPIAHNAHIGSYIIYRFSNSSGVPSKKAALDSRIISFSLPAAIAEIQFAALKPGWDKFLEYLAPKTVLCNMSEPACQLLKNSKDWKLVFDSSTPPEGLSPTRALRRSHSYHWYLLVRQ